MTAMEDVLTAHEFRGFDHDCGELHCKCGRSLEPSEADPDSREPHAAHVAQALANAGYRKPRTITDWAELAGLNMGVVRTSAGTIANIVDGRAYFFGYETSASVGGLGLPAVVLWEPAS